MSPIAPAIPLQAFLGHIGVRIHSSMLVGIALRRLAIANWTIAIYEQRSHVGVCNTNTHSKAWASARY